MFVVLDILIGIFALLFPGLMLSFLLFYGENGLGFWERIATSLGLSALIDMLIIMILAQKWLAMGLGLGSFMGGVLIFVLVCWGVIFMKGESKKSFFDFWSRSEVQN